MDYVYGDFNTTYDQNTYREAYASMKQNVLSCWEGTVDPLYINFSLKIPYYPHLIQSEKGKTIVPIFGIKLWDWYGPARQFFEVPTVVSPDVEIYSYGPAGLSSKKNNFMRYTSTGLRVVFTMTSSSITQGILSFVILRAVERGDQFYRLPISVHSQNSIAILNLANSRTVELNIPYDSMYPFRDNADEEGIQYYNYLACVPLSPIKTAADTATAVDFTTMYAPDKPEGAYAIMPYNLTGIDGTLADYPLRMGHRYSTNSSRMSQIVRMKMKSSKSSSIPKVPEGFNDAHLKHTTFD